MESESITSLLKNDVTHSETACNLAKDYIDACAIIEDNSLQDKLLKELMKGYAVLQNKVDALLKNTLPEVVADEIKYRGKFSPGLCDCTILFSDFIGFTRLSEQLSQTDLIEILSTKDNIPYISFYLHKNCYHYLTTIEASDFVLPMKNHTLRFIPTPHAHSPGSFVTYDEKSKILFSSDLFGSFLNTKELFLEIDPECHECVDYSNCQLQYKSCPINEILFFHRKMMPCGASLAYAMRQIDKLDIQCIAPQHGNIITRKKDVDFIIKKLSQLDNVGINGLGESI